MITIVIEWYQLVASVMLALVWVITKHLIMTNWDKQNATD